MIINDKYKVSLQIKITRNSEATVPDNSSFKGVHNWDIVDQRPEIDFESLEGLTAFLDKLVPVIKEAKSI